MEDIRADIARCVDAELAHIHAVLGPAADLRSPKLDRYYEEYRRLSRERGNGPLRASERQAIWDSICQPDAVTLAHRAKYRRRQSPDRFRLTSTESATCSAPSP